MEYKKSGNVYVVLLEKGDKIIEKLTEFCAKKKIKSGYFSGIGGASEIEVAYYDTREKKYHSKAFGSPPFEIVSLTGNVSLSGWKIKIHSHVVFSDSKFRVFGGHLNEAAVSPMCEIIFTPLKAKLKRKKDEATGLFFLDL